MEISKEKHNAFLSKKNPVGIFSAHFKNHTVWLNKIVTSEGMFCASLPGPKKYVKQNWKITDEKIHIINTYKNLSISLVFIYLTIPKPEKR